MPLALQGQRTSKSIVCRYNRFTVACNAILMLLVDLFTPTSSACLSVESIWWRKLWDEKWCYTVSWSRRQIEKPVEHSMFEAKNNRTIWTGSAMVLAHGVCLNFTIRICKSPSKLTAAKSNLWCQSLKSTHLQPQMFVVVKSLGTFVTTKTKGTFVASKTKGTFVAAKNRGTFVSSKT